MTACESSTHTEVCRATLSGASQARRPPSAVSRSQDRLALRLPATACTLRLTRSPRRRPVSISSNQAREQGPATQAWMLWRASASWLPNAC